MKKFDRGAAERKHDELAELYKTDPEEFERITRAEIDRIIEGADPEYRNRLRGLQFTIDTKLSKCKDPVARLNKMIELFWAGLDEFNIALDGQLPLDPKEDSAKVLHFEKKDKV